MEVEESPMVVHSDLDSLWRRLPDLPLFEIYSYVPFEDRVSMSCVCKAWSRGFAGPNLWEKVRFQFPKTSRTIDEHPIMKFAKKYGQCFRRIELFYRQDKAKTANYAAIQLLDFFDILISKEAQLQTLMSDNLLTLFFHLETCCRESVILKIARYLSCQRSLSNLDFRYSIYEKQNISYLLQSLGNKSSLTEIRFSGDIVWNALDVVENDSKNNHQHCVNGNRISLESSYDTHWLCESSNLESMEIDYTPFFEDLITNFPLHVKSCRKLKRNLMEIFLTWEGWNDDFQGISGDSWKNLKEIFPDLKINLIIDTTQSVDFTDPMTIINLLIRSNMPLECLEFKIDEWYANEFYIPKLSELLDHITYCKLNAELEELNLSNLPSERILEDMDKVFKLCANLKSMRIEVSYPLYNLFCMLQKWCDNPPRSLRYLSITVFNVPNVEEWFTLSVAVKHFQPKFEDVNIHLCAILTFEGYVD